MRDGFSDCFESKERRDGFWQKLIDVAREKDIPSDTEICKGESPLIGLVPFPHCVNHRWEIEKGMTSSLDSERTHDWDTWRVEARKTIGGSDDLYAGPPRVEEFDRDFNFIECVKVKKDREVIKFSEVG